MTKRKLVLFSFITLIFFTLVLLIITVFADLWAHKKFGEFGGLNHQGYRGKLVDSKEKNEKRIAVLGGSCAFGWGIHYSKALPNKLNEKINHYLKENEIKEQFTVLNLAYNNEGAYAYYYNLKDFSDLDYDYVLIYGGYNDLGPNTFIYRHTNPIFRLFGYMPILQVIIQEKMMLLKSGNNLESAYWGDEKIEFKPGMKKRIQLSIMDKMLNTYKGLETLLGNKDLTKNIDFNFEDLKTDQWKWYRYCIEKSIDYSLAQGKKVIVVTPPYASESQISQQESLRELIKEKYLDKDLLYVDLGNSMDLKDTTLSWDGLHFSEKGADMMADSIFIKIVDYIVK